MDRNVLYRSIVGDVRHAKIQRSDVPRIQKPMTMTEKSFSFCHSHPATRCLCSFSLTLLKANMLMVKADTAALAATAALLLVLVGGAQGEAIIGDLSNPDSQGISLIESDRLNGKL
jgi:hypothetical protein